MIKSGQVPEDLQQLYEEGSKNSPHPRFSRVHLPTKSFSRMAKASMCLLLEMLSSRFSRRTLRLAPTNLRLLAYLTPSCCGKKSRGNGQTLNDAERRGDVYQKDGYCHVRTVATAIEKKQASIHVERALEPILHWR